jgi:transcriptional regulator with XRE-family HTH domain
MIAVAKQEKNPTAVAFGNRLRALREEKGLTQTALGQLAGGMATSAVARLEAGDRTPSWDTVLLLARALGVSTDAFISDDDQEGDAPRASATRPPKGPKKK